MKEIITLCVRRPVTVIMLISALCMGAVYSIRLLPLDRLPEVINPKVTVETAYPGMGAAEVRAAVTIPLEDSLSSVKGLEEIRSVSRDSSSLIMLRFRWGTLPSRAAALVREAIDTVYIGLPQGVSKPMVISGEASEDPHAIIAVQSLTGDNSFARSFAEYELRSRLRRLDGAGAVLICGGEKDEIRIRADPARLNALSLNGSDLAGIIALETADFPAGSARESNRELTVVSSGRPKSQAELSTLVFASAAGPLRLSDLAVTARETAPRQSLFIFQNMEQTALEIYRRPGCDPVRLSGEIKGVIDECMSLFSRDVQMSVVYDASPSIVQGIKDLGVSGGFAALAVILILAVFMGRVSYSAFAVLALPVSVSAAFIALALSGRSLNSMSLGGLALSIGLVSDTSVIVLDLLCRRYGGSGKIPSPDETGSLVSSVSLSSLAGTLTTIVVFVPVIFLPGPLGGLFGDLALTLIVTVAAGWFYSQFCLPSLFCFFMAHNTSGAADTKYSKPFGSKPEKTYGLFLRKILRRPGLMVSSSVFLSLIGLALLYIRPMEFAAPDTVTEIEVTVDFPPGTLQEEAVLKGLAVSQSLSQLPEISHFYGRMGAEDDDTERRSNPDYSKEQLKFRCFLANGARFSGEADAPATVKKVNDLFKNYAFLGGWDSIRISAGFPEDRVARILGLSSVLTYAVKGNTPEESLDAAIILAGADPESITYRPFGTRPQIRLIPKREITASLGISSSDIASSLYSVFEGIVTGAMEIEGRPFDIRVSGTKNDLETLRTLPLTVSSSRENRSMYVYLSSLVDIEWIEAEMTLARQDRSDVIYLDLIPSSGKDEKTAGLSGGISPVNGVSRADESVFTRYQAALAATVILVLILLYLILGAQFESFLLPLILMLSVPFSLAGAGPALFLSNSSLDSGAVLGLVALFGLAVNNGIILYESSEAKILAGLFPAAAVYSGSLERFRPVLLTTLTTIAGLLPLVISPLGKSQVSMASTMLGGIIVSGFLAFFALPPVFIRYLKSRRRPV